MSLILTNKTQYINFGDILQPVANFTVSCWFYNTDNSTYQVLFGREDQVGNRGWHLEIDGNQLGTFHADQGSVIVQTTTTIALNTWYHIVGVRDATANQIRIYLNGVLEGTNTAGTLSTVTNPMRIGVPTDWPNYGFIGILDGIRFYDRVLDEDEIQTVYGCRGSDSIFYGLQAQWMFTGAENQGIGSFSTISISTIVNASSSTSRLSITFAYTAPVGSNLVLVVAATAEGTNSGRVIASTATFNGNALISRSSVRTTRSPYNGVAIFSKSITSGESGNIAVGWTGKNSRRTAYAYTLVNAQNVVEATATAFSNTGTVTSGLTTINDGAVVVTACANKDGYTMTAVGTGHVLDSSVTAGAHAGALGHVPVVTAGAISGIGFTATPTPNGEALALAAFTPYNTTEQVIELSDNKFIGTAYNVPKYQNTFLKKRRLNQGAAIMASIVLYNPDGIVVNQVTQYMVSANTPDYDQVIFKVVNPDLSALHSVPVKWWKVDSDVVVEMNINEKATIDASILAKTIRQKRYKILIYDSQNRLEKEIWYDTDNGDETYSGESERTEYTYDGSTLLYFIVTVCYYDGTVMSTTKHEYFKNKNTYEIIEKISGV